MIFFRFGEILFNFSGMFAAVSSVMKKALFLLFLRSPLINDLFDNLDSGKRNYCLVKQSGKSLEYIFWYMSKAKKDHLGISESKELRDVGTDRKELLPGLSPLVPRRTSMRTQASRDLESRLRLTPL